MNVIIPFILGMWVMFVIDYIRSMNKKQPKFPKKFKKVLTNRNVCGNIKTSSKERSMIYLFDSYSNFLDNILAEEANYGSIP